MKPIDMFPESMNQCPKHAIRFPDRVGGKLFRPNWRAVKRSEGGSYIFSDCRCGKCYDMITTEAERISFPEKGRAALPEQAYRMERDAMIDAQWIRDRKTFYNDHLRDVILKYWLDRADDEYGGFFTCYNNTGDRLVSTDKFVWSQGRLVWSYAKLAGADAVELDDATRRRCAALAAQGADFLLQHCLLTDGNCAFRLDRQGNPKEHWPGSGYAISTFADCFVMMGLAAYAGLSGDQAKMDTALRMFRAVTVKLRDGVFRTAPTVVPAGWRIHAAPMIVLNTGQELYEALRALGRNDEAGEVEKVCLEAMLDIVNRFRTDSGIVLESLDAAYQPLDDLCGRYLNPGHTNESMWFVIREAARRDMTDIVAKAARTVQVVSEKAWDGEYGGMMYYLDRDGGAPRGPVSAATRATAENIGRDWDNKLWWPHLETVYAALLCYSLTGSNAFFKEYERYHDYTFRVFPNPDPQVGEWIQIRDRQGRPGNPDVGGRLPVKDPYHTMRGLLLLIELLDKMLEEKSGH